MSQRNRTDGGVRERLVEVLNTTIVTPDGDIEASGRDRHDKHRFLYNCAVCQGNVPAIVSAVLAALDAHEAPSGGS